MMGETDCMESIFAESRGRLAVNEIDALGSFLPCKHVHHETAMIPVRRQLQLLELI